MSRRWGGTKAGKVVMWARVGAGKINVKLKNGVDCARQASLSALSMNWRADFQIGVMRDA
jgi:hypothetical protein